MNKIDAILEDLRRAIREMQMPPAKDPFNANAIVPDPDFPEPSALQKRFYIYYHRPTTKLILRYGSSSYICDDVKIKGIDIYFVEHTEGPLRYMASGNGNRLYINGSKAVIT